MTNRQYLVLSAIVFVGSIAATWWNLPPADTRPDFDSVVSSLENEFGAGRLTAAAPEIGLGQLWGTYAEDETIRLWVNGAPGASTVMNIKLSVLSEKSAPPPSLGLIRARALLAMFMPDIADKAESMITNCLGSYTRPGWKMDIECTYGPKLDERVMVLTARHRPKG